MESTDEPMMRSEFEAVPTAVVSDEPESRPGGIPLYVWVIAAAVLAIPVGYYFGEGAARLELFPKLILRALTALAAPLVVLAILSAVVTNEIRGRQGGAMMFFYFINTLVAMVIGLTFTNLVRPGEGVALAEPGAATPVMVKKTVSDLVLELVPKSVGEAFATNNLAQLVLLTLALGVGLTQIRDNRARRGDPSFGVVVELLNTGFEVLMKVLLWVVATVPLAVFGIVAASVGEKEGMKVFESLIWLILVVVLGLTCQVVWYLVQMAVLARMSPVRFLTGALDVMAGTFSTASTAATIPITLSRLGRLGVSRRSSQLAACIGTNFNNDGTALYQASAAIFMAQSIGYQLSLADQIVIMLTTLVASVGAGGIPSGSFVTLPLIFSAVRLPADKIPILLTVDWLLDRCRTTSNVLGDMTVAVLLDRFFPPEEPPSPEAETIGENQFSR
jgi:DAACS family dicarboxylate/amino acid:cation (Na+ or H+) symporter